ncbi:MAG: hypothetical protein EOO72_12180, partial [Myxococcaceae bacterium]
MRAMVLHAPGQPLREEHLPLPEPGPEQVLLKVHACAVCRTDLHVVDGELTWSGSAKLVRAFMEGSGDMTLTGATNRL